MKRNRESTLASMSGRRNSQLKMFHAYPYQPACLYQKVRYLSSIGIMRWRQWSAPVNIKMKVINSIDMKWRYTRNTEPLAVSSDFSDRLFYNIFQSTYVIISELGLCFMWLCGATHSVAIFSSDLDIYNRPVEAILTPLNASRTFVQTEAR